MSLPPSRPFVSRRFKGDWASRSPSVVDNSAAANTWRCLFSSPRAATLDHAVNVVDREIEPDDAKWDENQRGETCGNCTGRRKVAAARANRRPLRIPRRNSTGLGRTVGICPTNVLHHRRRNPATEKGPNAQPSLHNNGFGERSKPRRMCVYFSFSDPFFTAATRNSTSRT